MAAHVVSCAVNWALRTEAGANKVATGMAWHVAKILSVQGTYKISFIDFPSIVVQRERLEDALAEAGDRLQGYVGELRAMGIMPPRPGPMPPAAPGEPAGGAEASFALFEVKEVARESSTAPPPDDVPASAAC